MNLEHAAGSDYPIRPQYFRCALQLFHCWLVLAALLSFSAPARAQELDLELRGNVALTREVYFTVLAMSGTPRKRKLADRAAEIREVLIEFLHGSGYELARIDARLEGSKIVLEIDEGRLDKIIFVDQGAFRALELHFTLSLPGRVFNRPLLERQLEDLTQRLGLSRAHYRVVPVQKRDEARFEPGEGLIRGLRLLSPGEPYELLVYLEHPSRTTGLDLGLELRPPDGLSLIGAWRLRDLFAGEDLLELKSKLGGRVEGEPREGYRVGLSRARLSAEWFTPPLLGTWLRTSFLAEADLFGRTREDLGLRQYYFSPLRAAVNLALITREEFQVSAGGGLEQRLIFGLEPFTSLPEFLKEQSEDHSRAFGLARVSWITNPEELRRDRRNLIDLELRYYARGSDGSPTMWSLEALYQSTWMLGWDELKVDVHGEVLGPDVPYYLQISMRDGHLRVAYSTEFVERVVSLGLEYRLSLTRDLLKVSLFNEVALAGQLLPDFEGPRWFDSFGVGLHLLALDIFQLNAYGGVGLSSTGDKLQGGFTLRVSRAF